jgi:anaerobic ribonucleoside-triphosphate reductase activating protein
LTSDGAPRLLRIGAVRRVTEAEGPGRRFAVWAQGCSIRCVGCFNPHLLGTRGGWDASPADLAADALGAARDLGVDGVTLLGGEPFEQAAAFAEFAALARGGGLTVMTFTGFEREFLEGPTAPRGAADLLAATDLLVDGPYLADQIDLTRPWVGSANQRFHFLTDRLKEFEPRLADLPDRLEVRIDATGRVTVNGWATTDQLDRLLADLVRPPRGA